MSELTVEIQSVRGKEFIHSIGTRNVSTANSYIAQKDISNNNEKDRFAMESYKRLFNIID
jgi:hypothetical protein